MPLRSAQVSITNAAAQLLVAPAQSQKVRIKNTGANAIFIGPAGVTTGTGYTLAAAAAEDFHLGADEAIYATCTTGPNVIHVFASGAF